MSDLDLAVNCAKRLERLLEKNFNASGRGLHELVNSVEGRLPEHLVRKLRKVATIRNKIVHQENYTKIDDRKGFVRACDEAEKELRSLSRSRASRRGPSLMVVLAVVAIALAAIAYLLVIR